MPQSVGSFLPSTRTHVVGSGLPHPDSSGATLILGARHMVGPFLPGGDTIVPVLPMKLLHS